MERPPSLPVTVLAPLHTQQPQHGASRRSHPDLHWRATLQRPATHEAVVEAYTHLVGLLVGTAAADVDDEEAVLCISLSHGAHTSALVVRPRQAAQHVAVDGPVPSDFSVAVEASAPTASKMHLDVQAAVDGLHLHLSAHATHVPSPALVSLGATLLGLLDGNGGPSVPFSVLNPAHHTRPVPFATQPDAPSCALLHRWVEQRTREHPARLAIDYLDVGRRRRQYSYAHISSSSNALAGHIVAASQKRPHRRIAVLMGPSPELYTAYLACLKAGHTFCPLPTDAPLERLRVILEDLEPSLVLTNGDTHDVHIAGLRDWPRLNATDILEAPQLPTPLSVDLACEDDVAYIMYTSGTTGKPKGVAITQLAAACSIAAHLAVAPMSTGTTPTRWFQFAAPTFDPSIMEIFVTLCSGSTLCSAQRHLTLQDINTTLATMQVDVMMATPSLATLVDPARVSALWTMGEALSASVLESFAQHNPGALEKWDSTDGPQGMYNAYGPTEAAINCTLQPHVPATQRGTVLGKPLPSCTLAVVHRQGTVAVPMGCVGELLIAGPQVSAVGYLNRPAETAMAFVDDSPWGRAYRTGDRARLVWDEAGEPMVEYLGRLSEDQVKLSGRRVELGEIDTVLAREVASIRESISCLWRPSNSGEGSEKVVTVLSLREGAEWDSVEGECRAAATKHLPGYMRPFKLLHLQQLPRSAAGKLDRKASTRHVHDVLAATAPGETSLPQAAPAPETSLTEDEALMVAIVSEVVGAPVSPTAPLVDAGLDSLRAMRVLREVRRRALNMDVTLALLLSSDTTVRSLFLADSGEDDRRTDASLALFADTHSAQTGFPPGDVEIILPTTATQSGMITSLARSSHSQAKTYINHSVYTLAPDTLSSQLYDAFAHVIAEQPMYRTAIVPVEDDLAPFAQCVLTTDASHARQFLNIHHYSNANAGSEAERLQWAEERIDLKAQRFYCIQVVSGPSGRGGYAVASFAHAIFDGASLEVLMSDVARRYAGLESHPPRYGIREAVQAHFRARSQTTDDYWLAHTAGFQHDELPVLSGNVEAVTAKWQPTFDVVQHVGDVCFDELSKRARQMGSTPLAVLQTAWALLLAAYSESDTGDVMFGSVVTGDLATTCHAPTFSTLPCRVRLQQSSRVDTVAKELASASLRAQAMAHPSYGLIKTADGRLPYDTLLALQQYPPEESEDCPLPWSAIHYPAMANDFAMLVEVWPSHPHNPRRGTTDTPVVFKATYDQLHFSAQSALTIMQQLAAVVMAILDSPVRTPSDVLASLPRTLLAADGDVPASSNTPLLLHSPFEERVRSSPDALALAFAHNLGVDGQPRTTQWSYRELNRRASILARLIADASGPVLEDRAIPISLERSPELYVAVLAILKAGAAWCPVDPAFPDDRRRSLIARCRSPIVVTSRAGARLGADVLPEGVSVLDVEEAYESGRLAILPPRIQQNNLAYVIWTSGTTGQPKGVMVEHLAAAEAMSALQQCIVHDDDKPVRVLQFSAFSFDVFVQDLFYAWGLGGVVVGATRELMLGSFVPLVWAMQPSHAHLTPSFGASVSTEELRGSSLQVVTMIGEKLTEAVAEPWAAITTASYNTYGPAENAVVSTLRKFTGRSRDMAKAANVGLPMSPVTSYVMDASDTQLLVPRYAVGELALGGRQIARGYLDDAGKTSSQFVWSEAAGERIYRTGDLVRRVDHGIEFLGRNDDLVKLSGIRVELSEISAMCARADDTIIEHVETLLLARPERPDVRVVVSFVSLRASQAATEDGKTGVRALVHKQARENLPSYMVPGRIVVMDSMPRTASAKVDRNALKAVYLAIDEVNSQESENSPEIHEVWTPGETRIVAMVAQMVSIEDVGSMRRSDRLASLGLSSIAVIKLAWALKRQLSINVAVMDLVACESLADLLACVVVDSTAASPSQAISSAWLDSVQAKLAKRFGSCLAPSSRLLPATAMQESLVVETMRDRKSYWSHRMWRLSADVDLDRLRQAWQEATQVHDILRTSFVPPTELDGQAMAWCRNEGLLAAVLLCVSNEEQPPFVWSVDHLDAVLDIAARERQARQPGTLGVSPWSVNLLEGEGKERVMMVNMHHALHDAWSYDRIMQTVEDRYNNRISDAPATAFTDGLASGLLPTAEERTQAKHWWEQHFAQLRASAGELASPSFPDLTQSRQKPAKRILRSSRSFDALDGSACRTILGAASPSMLFQAAFGCVVAEYLELKAAVLGQTISQRILDSKLTDVVGPAIVTVPYIARLDYSCAELLQEMASYSSKLGLTLKVHPSVLRAAMGTDGQALYPGLFVFHPQSTSSTSADPASLLFAEELDDVVGLRVEHALALNVFEQRQGYRLELSGDSEVLSQSQLQLMLDQVEAQVHTMLQHPDIRLDQLTNVMPTALASISTAHKLEGDEGDYPAGSALDPTAWVQHHARHHPTWTAALEIDVEEETEQECTFAELDAASDAIIGRLAAAGIPKGSVVALSMARNLASLAATVAIFKAGYVYLPIDEELPTTRKDFLVRDSHAAAVLASPELVADLATVDGMAVLHLDGSVFHTRDGPPCAQEPPTLPGGYVLYTSGSTGVPKGVRVLSRNLCSFVHAFTRRMIQGSPSSASLAGKGRYLNLASRAFDPHLTQMFAAWRLGYAAVIGPRMAILSNLERIINDVGITHFGSVPSVLLQLRLAPRNVPSVRVVTTGGEKASNELLDMWTGDGDGPLLMNVYGPTECTIGCVSKAVDAHSNARNIGLPLDVVRAVILLPGDVVAKRGQPGEVCIAGDLVSTGYLGRPEEQAKAFGETARLEPGRPTRIYRTGDVMRMMADDTLEFLGRKDQQAKVRGQRLELGEVVSFLQQAAHAEEYHFAAIVAEREGVTNAQLFAFCARSGDHASKDSPLAIRDTLNGDEEALTVRLLQACTDTLPAYMVPHHLLWVTHIPHQAASGKVDVKQLNALVLRASLAQVTPNSGVGAVATEARALTGDERSVAEAVALVAGSEMLAVRPEQTVYELGIDSLSAVHLAALLRQRGFAVRMADVLTQASIANLAQCREMPQALSPEEQTKRIDARLAALEAAHLSEVLTKTGRTQSDVARVLPTLPLQAALVARSLAMLHDGDEDVPYVSHFSYTLSDAVDIVRWRQVVEEVVEAEAMLRTTFVQLDDGTVLQVVAEQHSALWTRSATSAHIVSSMHALPPVRFSQEGRDVVLSIHHGLFDGRAIEVLRQQIQQRYEQPSTGVGSRSRIASLRALSQLAHHCHPTDIDDAHRFWQDYLRGAKPCHVGSTARRQPSRSSVQLATSTETLRDQARRGNLSLQAVMESAMVLLLARLTGHSDIVYGLIVSLRALVESVVEQAHSFVGPCLNTLVKRGTLQHNDSPFKLALALRDTHASCLMDSNALQPVEKVQRWTGCEDKLFDALLSVNMPTELPEAPPTPPVMTAVATSSSSDLPLAVDVDVQQGGVTVTLSSSCMDEARLATLAHDFEHFCQLVVEGSTVSVGMLMPEVQYAAARREVQTEAPTDLRPLDVDETVVRDALCQLLSVAPESVGRGSSLYQLGLDSVVVLTLAKLIRQKSGVKVGPVAVLRARTVQAIAELVRQGRRSSGRDRDGGNTAEAAHQSDVEALAREVGVPMSEQQLAYLATPIQEGMLSATAAHAQDGGDTRQPYIYDHIIELTDEVCRVDPERSLFRTAWATLVGKVDILRTTFHLTQDDKHPWLAIVRRSMPTACDGDAVELARCPAVWTVVPSTRLATLRMHHAVYDGASLPTLWAAFASEYAALLELTGSPTTVSPPFSTFAKQVAMQQDGAVLYWCRSLEGYTYEPAETGNQTTETRHQVRTALDAPTTKHLRAQCQGSNVTLQTALMLTWARVLAAEVLHQPDVVFGQVLGGSAQEGSAGDMVGPTMNTLPIRIRLQGSLSDVLQAVQRTSEDAQLHQVASLRRIHKHWRNASPRPTPPSLFESLFVFDQAQSTDKHSHLLWNHVVEGGGDQGGFAEYPLVISLHLQEGALQTRVSASSLLYQDRQPVQALAEQFQALLSGLLSDTVGSKQLDAPPFRSPGGARQLKNAPQANPPPSVTPEQQGIAQEIIAAATMTLSGKESVEVGLATNLFAVGLDSISAIRLSSQLRRGGVLLSVVDIMRAPIVSVLAAKARRRESQPAASKDMATPLISAAEHRTALDRLSGQDADVESVLPVLAGQEMHLRYWLFGGQRFFEPAWIYRVDGSEEEVRRSWFELQRRHAVLRTTFVRVGAKLLQVTFRTALATTFLQTTNGECSLDALVDRIVVHDNALPSDLSTPPVRLAFVKGMDGAAVVLRLHHALYDAWSIKALVADLGRLIAGESLPDTTTSLEWVVRQVHGLRSPAAEKRFWAASLAHGETTLLGSLPTDASPLGAQHLARFANITPQATREALSHACLSTARCSSVLLVAFAQMLQAWSGAIRPTFGFYHAARSLSSTTDDGRSVDLTSAAVPTLSLTPMTVDLTHGSLSDRLALVQDRLAQLSSFGQTPLSDMPPTPQWNAHINLLFRGTPDEQQRGHRLNRMRLDPATSNAYFTHQHPLARPTPIDGVDTARIPRERLFVDVVVDAAGGISLGIRCDASLYSPDQVAALAHDYAARIDALACALQRP